MSKVPHNIEECVHTDDFSRYKSEHRAEHDKLNEKVEAQSAKVVGVEAKLTSLIAVNRLILGAIVTGIVSIVVILLTRGI